MKLAQLAAKPTLVKITLDDADIVEEYKEPIEFYTHDRQPLDVFLGLSNAIGSDNQSRVVEILKTLILDEDGKRIIKDSDVIPAKVLVRAMTKVMDLLGK